MSHKKDLISILDVSQKEIWNLIIKAQELKKDRLSHSKALSGKTLAMIFQKPSTRTSVSFAAGMVQLGGFPLILNPQDLQIKRGETIQDTAKILSRFVDGIMIRANCHKQTLELASCSSVPVISGLTDKEHPCQALADMQTIAEKKNLTSIADFKKIKFAYLGDGNNMAHSLLLVAASLGMQFVIASPQKYQVEADYVAKAKELAAQTGSKILLTQNPQEAAQNADILYTDVWASMGKEDEAKQREEDFADYQINQQLLDLSAKDSLVMHCLPAHRGQEISADVLDGVRSIVLDQAENRLHMQKAILLHLLNS